MFYKNLIINKHFQGLIKNNIKKNKVPHALLLYGNNGTGKEGHAIELAATLNCKSKINYEACGHCHSCIQLKSMQHPNINFILPYPKRNSISKNDLPEKTLNNKDIQELQLLKQNKIKNPYSKFKLNNANTILINSIRFLKKEIYNTSIESGWKINIIFEADKLCNPNQESANALLKILEEPPNNTIFILITNKYDKMINTITSRCQNFYFRKLSFDLIKNNLNNNIEVNTLKLLIKLYDGNFELIKNNLNKIDDINEKIIQILKYLFYINQTKFKSFISSIDKSNWDEYMKLFIVILRDLKVLKSTKIKDSLILQNYLSKYEKIVYKYSDAKFLQCIKSIERTNNFIFQNGYFPLLIASLNIEIKRHFNNQINQSFLI